MNGWFFGWPSELSDSDCDNLLSMYDPKLSKVAEVGHTNFRQNTELRKSKVVGINLFNDLHKEIARIIDPYIVMANREVFGFDLNGVSEFQIAKYSEGDFFTEHMDMYLSDNASSRKISITVQLSDPDDYEGGDFIFGKDLPHIDPIIRRRGSIVVFPSFVYHEITPITKGTRYSLVGCYEGAKWK